jgi:hypothetical protein
MDNCDYCGIELSARFGFGCCDACSERLAEQFEQFDQKERAGSLQPEQ